MSQTKILVTGSSGFIGHHLCALLLDMGYQVMGVDGMTDYYDISLKRHRNQLLLGRNKFQFSECMLEDKEKLETIAFEFEPHVIIHLAAQAGVRYSIDFPETYVSSNLIGTFNILEIAKKLSISHLLMASTSSVYGANEEMPFEETQKCDHQMSFLCRNEKVQ